MALFDDNMTKQLKDLIGELPQKIELVYFMETNCESCEDAEKFLTEITALNKNISLNINDLSKDSVIFETFNVTRTPAIAIVAEDGTDYGIRFYGIPSGYEINSFIGSIREVGGFMEPLGEDMLKRIKAIDKDVHIQVFVTPTCPHCPGPVMVGHKLAMLNPHIKADMVEATTFPGLSQKYGVRGVPKIVINETSGFVGSQPLGKFMEVIEALS